jgi:hypothetical protein
MGVLLILLGPLDVMLPIFFTLLDQIPDCRFTILPFRAIRSPKSHKNKNKQKNKKESFEADSNALFVYNATSATHHTSIG